jgi:hypothetical protein
LTKRISSADVPIGLEMVEKCEEEIKQIVLSILPYDDDDHID